MIITVEYTSEDVSAFRTIVEAQRNRSDVTQRLHRNVNGPVPRQDRETLWHTMFMCLLTSQQRSGPWSPISRFLAQDPFPLSLHMCKAGEDQQSLIERTIREYGGIRFGPKISELASRNLDYLEAGGWADLEEWVNRLIDQRLCPPDVDHIPVEREAARFVQYHLGGFGPKQSRNFWQSLGLTRYEFVLDSRVLKWLREINFPIPLSSMALGSEEYYCFLSEILIDGCLRAEVLPCVWDAAVFASFDKQEWAVEENRAV